MKSLFLLILLLSPCVSFSQSMISEASLRSSGIVSSGKDWPFWMLHNQLGKYASNGNWQQLTEGKLFGDTQLARNLSLHYGANLALLISKDWIDPKIIEAYLGLSAARFRLRAGSFADEERMGGLSSTNGDLVRSLNYRPYPKVRLSTQGFIPFLIAKSWFRFNAEYDEGLLTGERIIDRPHLHHKSLMFQFRSSSTMRFVVGINHYVFWGGNSAQDGPLPKDLKSYFLYVTGCPGDSRFLENDQMNVAGNHLGSYLFTGQKDFENVQLEIRINHPFEDGSGMGFVNVKDNLYAFHFRKNKTGYHLEELLVEYLYSKHQSGSFHREAGAPKERRGRDNYLNHGIYQTGFTFLGQSMGTPLFEPLRFNQAAVVSGVANNRVSAFHVGAKGQVSQNLKWKGMMTYSRNFGTFSQPYHPIRQQVYSLGELRWKSNNHPFLFSALMAIDFGQLSISQIGMGFQVQWIFK